MTNLTFLKKLKIMLRPANVPTEVLERTSPVVLHIGDIPSWYYPYTKRMLKKIRPEILVHTGDMVDECKVGRLPADIPAYKRRVKRLVAMMRRYAKTVYFVYGNNDLPDYIKQLAPDFIHLHPNTCTDILGARFLLCHRVMDIDGDAQFYLYGHGFTGDTYTFTENGADGKVYANVVYGFHAVFPDKNLCIRIPTKMYI